VSEYKVKLRGCSEEEEEEEAEERTIKNSVS